MSTTLDFGPLKVQVEEKNDQCVLRFIGDVNELFDPREVISVLNRYEHITFNLKEINTFNSCGVREWLDMMGHIPTTTILEIINCSIAVIDQINMVPTITGHGAVKSFFGPYYCECSGEQSKFIDMSSNITELENNIAPTFDCSTCDEQLEFDAIEESYFSFCVKRKINKVS